MYVYVAFRLESYQMKERRFSNTMITLEILCCTLYRVFLYICRLHEGNISFFTCSMAMACPIRICKMDKLEYMFVY